MRKRFLFTRIVIKMIRRKIYLNKLQAQINKKFRELRGKEKVRLMEFEKLRKNIAKSLIPNWQILLEDED